MSCGFEYCRAVQKSAIQNQALGEQRLAMLVLALKGDAAVGDNLRKELLVFAERGVIEDCGHYVVEEQPEKVASEPLAFFGRVDSDQ